MADEHDLLPEEEPVAEDEPVGELDAHEPGDAVETYADEPESEPDDDLDVEEAWATESGTDSGIEARDDDVTGEMRDEPDTAVEPASLDETERLRPLRADRFRRGLRMQISMLPLALFLLALGGFLIARRQEVDGLPDLADLTLVIGAILMLAFTLVFRALLFGRRERGLLLAGLWVWLTAGAAGVVIYGIEQHPDLADWWPLVLVSLGLTFFMTFLVERTHDTRLVLLSMISLVAAGAAFWAITGDINEKNLEDVIDYWPLLLSVVGIGFLPVALRRRAG
ncbi:MAG: hypothetical protein JXJ20_01165 [Anaerolineae bacterium]|nr:hypothetical protein [Anaerolineae bacterium]